jgi:hypothetical protein
MMRRMQGSAPATFYQTAQSLAVRLPSNRQPRNGRAAAISTWAQAKDSALICAAAVPLRGENNRAALSADRRLHLNERTIIRPL